MPTLWKVSSNTSSKKRTFPGSKIKFSRFGISSWLSTKFTQLNISKTSCEPPTASNVDTILQPDSMTDLGQHFQFGSPNLVEFPWNKQPEEALTPWQKLWEESTTISLTSTPTLSHPKRKRKNVKALKPNDNKCNDALSRQLQLSLDQWEGFSRAVNEIDKLPQNSGRKVAELQRAFDYYKNSAAVDVIHIENEDSNTKMIVQEDALAILDVNPFRFLNLPMEIRFQVYELLLRQRPNLRLQLIYRLREFRRNEDGVMQLPWDSILYPEILRVNRQIHAEASAILYGKGIVEFQRSLQPLTLTTPRATSPWAFIKRLVVHRILPSANMPHTPSSWRELILSKLKFDTLISLQTACFEFSLHSKYAKCAIDMVEPIYAAFETLLLERKQRNSSGPTLNIISPAFIGALRSRFGRWYSDFETAATGTVFIGLVADDVHVPKHFSFPSGAHRPSTFDVVWYDFRDSKMAWITADKKLEFPGLARMEMVSES